MAFTSHHGLYRLVRLPFGLRYAPSIRRTVDVVMYSVKMQFALVYLEDLVVFQNAAASHRPCMQSPLAIAQHRCRTQIKEEWILYEHHRILGSRNSPKTLGTRFSPDGRHSWTPTTHQPDETWLIPWLVQGLPTILR